VSPVHLYHNYVVRDIYLDMNLNKMNNKEYR